jgi:hypothetical protein
VQIGDLLLEVGDLVGAGKDHGGSYGWRASHCLSSISTLPSSARLSLMRFSMVAK